jgi:GNAT superfamily N-acetyltransferase
MPDFANVVITTDPSRADVDAALSLLHTTYWGRTMTRECLARAMAHSLLFCALDGATLLAFARVITDRATFAYLTDFVVAAGARGAGLGHRMLTTMIEHPELQGLRRFALLTGDAGRLYEKFGFEVGAGRLTYMERR